MRRLIVEDTEPLSDWRTRQFRPETYRVDWVADKETVVAGGALGAYDQVAAPRSRCARKVQTPVVRDQCTAAYMIFCSVASDGVNSSTIRPWRATRMRSDRFRISGR